MMKLRETYYLTKKYLKHYNAISALYHEQYGKNVDKQVQLWNWWNDERTAHWLEHFIENNGLVKDTKKTIALGSVFGEREVLEHAKTDVKIFFSGENLHSPFLAQYADYMLSGNTAFDLAMGFDNFTGERYMRFPLWLVYMFEPHLDKKQIQERCEQLRFPEVVRRDKFACLIARADMSGIRASMYEGLSEVGKVDCPSGLFHNDDSLKGKFGDNKVAYMKQYLFNICPENSNADGYCTEKVFEAIAAGCIPVYWGCNNMPEHKILNQEAIIFWDKESNGAKAIAQIKALCADKMKLEEFLRKPRLIPNAEEEVQRMMNELYNRIKALL